VPNWAATVLAELNAVRAVEGKTPYLYDPRLAAAAMRHASFVAGPAAPAIWGDGALYDGWKSRVEAADYPTNSPIGISVVCGPASPKGAVEKIGSSLAGRNAIMNDAYEAFGGGNIIDPRNVHWWVAIWGGVPPTA
jgi:hypothetical protein